MSSVGIDIGSLSAKAALLRNGEIDCWVLQLTGADPVASAQEVMDKVLVKAGISLMEVGYVVSTGYGRIQVPFAKKNVTEISCHARGSHWFFPEARTILDMGGQDCKAIRCDEEGRVTNFALNDKCAAGTGRYLERVAHTLSLGLEQIGPLSLQPMAGPQPVSNFCAVFAERDIIQLLRKGKSVNDILAGATDAIVDRVLSLLDRVQVVEAMCISGGVAKNIGVVKRLEERLGAKARIAAEPQIVGALGAALFAADRTRPPAE